MLFSRHVYSNWYLRQVAAMVFALSSPRCVASSFAIDSVDSKVPYRSNAIAVLFADAMFTIENELCGNSRKSDI